MLPEPGRWDPNPYSPATPPVTPSGERGSGHQQRPLFGADLQPVETILGRNRWWQRQSFDLRGVDLRRASLERVYLKRANLAGVNLEGANLKGANLMKVHLKGADLGGVHLEGANLMNAHLE